MDGREGGPLISIDRLRLSPQLVHSLIHADHLIDHSLCVSQGVGKEFPAGIVAVAVAVVVTIAVVVAVAVVVCAMKGNPLEERSHGQRCYLSGSQT